MDLKRSSFTGRPMLSATMAISMAAVRSGTSYSFTAPAEPGAGLWLAGCRSVMSCTSVTSLSGAVRAASAALITVAVLQVARVAFLHYDVFQETGKLADLFNPIAIVYGIILYFVYKKTDKHPILYICISAAVGILLQM